MQLSEAQSLELLQTRGVYLTEPGNSARAEKEDMHAFVV